MHPVAKLVSTLPLSVNIPCRGLKPKREVLGFHTKGGGEGADSLGLPSTVLNHPPHGWVLDQDRPNGELRCLLLTCGIYG